MLTPFDLKTCPKHTSAYFSWGDSVGFHLRLPESGGSRMYNQQMVQLIASSAGAQG